MEEKRKYPRVNSHFSLDVIPSDAGTGKTHNVSEGGLLFEHEGAIAEGQYIDLTLRVPGLSGTTKVKGRVVRSVLSHGNTYNVAVNFVDTNEATAKAIKELLESF